MFGSLLSITNAALVTLIISPKFRELVSSKLVNSESLLNISSVDIHFNNKLKSAEMNYHPPAGVMTKANIEESMRVNPYQNRQTLEAQAVPDPDMQLQFGHKDTGRIKLTKTLRISTGIIVCYDTQTNKMCLVFLGILNDSTNLSKMENITLSTLNNIELFTEDKGIKYFSTLWAPIPEKS